MMFFFIMTYPFLEFALAMSVIEKFGFANAFFAWLVSLVLGVGLFRTSSLRLTVGVGRAMREGKPPGAAAIDGALIGLAGVLFLLPGYISDFLALLLLIPPLRRWAARRLLRALSVRSGPLSRPAATDASTSDAAHAVLDVEARVISEGKQDS